VAVNNAGKKPQETPSREATGSISNTAPNNMMTINTNAISLAGCMVFLGFLAQK
jgi:hypothetical protein